MMWNAKEPLRNISSDVVDDEVFNDFYEFYILHL